MAYCCANDRCDIVHHISNGGCMDRAFAKKILLEIGDECGYTVHDGGSEIQIYFDREKHGIAFKIKDSTHKTAKNAGWLQVHHWEGDDWGPALHSLRSLADVLAFSQTLITFSSIKSKVKSK